MNENKHPFIVRDFNTLALVLIPIGIAINYVGGLVVRALELPVFLDTIGTLIVGIIAGPWVGAATGLIHNLLFGLTVNPMSLPFAIVNMALGLAAGFMARAGWFEKPIKVFFAGLVIVAVSVLTSVPISVWLFGGAAHGPTGVITGYLIAVGAGIWKAVFAVSIFRELADKLISAYVAYGVYKTLPARFLARFPGYTRTAAVSSVKAAFPAD